MAQSASDRERRGRGQREGDPVDVSDRVGRRGRDSGETTRVHMNLKKKKKKRFRVSKYRVAKSEATALTSLFGVQGESLVWEADDVFGATAARDTTNRNNE